jgi:hypothetical protein
MWIYAVRSGRLFQNDVYKATGYSGSGTAKNDPTQQYKHNLGPIPVGVYLIGKAIETTASHGPVVMPLTPVAYSETFGRSAFMIHGNSIRAPGSASHGCVILNRPIREEIAASMDRLLVVLSGLVSLSEEGVA